MKEKHDKLVRVDPCVDISVTVFVLIEFGISFAYQLVV